MDIDDLPHPVGPVLTAEEIEPLATGEYGDGMPVPLLTCGIALALILGLIGWLLW